MMNDGRPCDDESTARALRALAHLVTHVRPDWDPPGVLAQLGRAHTAGRSLPELTFASLRAAQDPANRTPAVIPLDGNHWRETPTAPAAPARPYDRAKVDGQPAAIADLPAPGDYTRGAALARALLHAKAAQE